tara:strand:- start:340 stop:519 length:180 start_codon:yes stop_codon:yes gene_type:complete
MANIMKQLFINKLNDLLLTYQAQVLIDVATEDEPEIPNKVLVEIGPMLHKVKELVEETA